LHSRSCASHVFKVSSLSHPCQKYSNVLFLLVFGPSLVSLTGFLATEWSMCTMKTSYHDSRLQILTIYDCKNMFTAGFTVQYVSPCRYVQKMSKEVEGEEAGQRLNGSCEPRNKKNLQRDSRGVIDKVFNHGTLSRHFRFLHRKKQPATATSSQQPPASNRQPTANTSTSTRRNFSPGTWGFIWRGEGGFVGENSKPRLSFVSFLSSAFSGYENRWWNGADVAVFLCALSR